jgi:hypothetical protein
VRFVTGRVNARAVIPEILELLAHGGDLSPTVDRGGDLSPTVAHGGDLSPTVGRVVSWDDAPAVWPAMTGKTVFTRV